ASLQRSVTPRMKHFFNPDLLAFNALTAPVDEAIVRQFLPLCSGELDESQFELVTRGWATGATTFAG
ncbi:MAG: hypothetical protein ABIR63_06570, partial [Sphingomicrobium sp.]